MSEFHRLEFTSPAAEWVEALPLGNGRLGAMVYGRAERELIWLSEGSVWSGPGRREHPHPVSSETARTAIVASRAAIAAGDHVAAEDALRALQHSYPQSFQPLARLRRTIGSAAPEPAPHAAVVPEQDGTGGPGDRPAEYARGLDLQTATAWTRASDLQERSFVSDPHQVLVLEVSAADRPVTFVLDSPLRIERAEADSAEALLVLRAPDDVAPAYNRDPDPVRWADEPRGVQAAVALRALGGRVRTRTTTDGVVLDVDGDATLILAVQTTFTRLGEDPAPDAEDAVALARALCRTAAELGVERLHTDHVAAHTALYDRAELSLGITSDATPGGTSDSTSGGTDAVVDAAGAGYAAAPELVALLFHYGRYLLISSSRPGGTPANLQGVWNQQMQPPWSSDFTMNINLEMNYWLAETTGLAECAEPLFDLIEALSVRGREPAERIYGSAGWVAHHASDIWAFVDPMGDGTHDPAWAFWPFAGVWLSSHLVDRLVFSHDPAAARRFWPVLEGAARFVLDWLEPRPDGSLGTSPSTSPENRFIVPGGAGAISSVAADSTMDLELARNLLRSLLRIGEDYALTAGSAALCAEAEAALDRIPQIGVDSQGLLREWAGLEQMADPRHRHIAHLVGVHPTDAAPSAGTATAASRSLNARGDEGTGWSLAWKMAMRARLREPEAAGRLLDLLVRRNIEIEPGPTGGRWRGGLYRNLFSAHPPFQIDGNLGLVAAVAECLLQSHAGRLDLLPALPPGLPDGSVRGLRARGGILVDLNWRDGALTEALLTATEGSTATTVLVTHGERRLSLELAPAHPIHLTAADFTGTDPTREHAS